jgi:aryl-alcohol dehydrogenase-like predicted oxidoreductase
MRMWDGPDGEGLGRAHVERAIEDSLRRLQVETIDLYQCHAADPNTPIEETLAAFGELVGSGKVRHVGASNYPPSLLEEALTVADAQSLPRFATLQPHHNLAHRAEFETMLAGVCQREGLGVIPYSPLGGGFLTGKYRRDQPLPKSARAEGVKRYLNEKGFRVIDALDAVAQAHDTTVAAAALAWQLANPVITAPIIGANTSEQLADLLPATELSLTDAEIAALDAASDGM